MQPLTRIATCSFGLFRLDWRQRLRQFCDSQSHCMYTDEYYVIRLANINLREGPHGGHNFSLLAYIVQ